MKEEISSLMIDIFDFESNNITPTIMDNNILTITPNQIIMGVNTNHQEIVSNPPKGTNFPAIKINVAPIANNLILFL
jgi:hypothetical protein